jgi:hypothetical protein
MLKEFLRNGVGTWNGLTWHGIEIGVGSWECGSELQGSIKLTENLFYIQEGL